VGYCGTVNPGGGGGPGNPGGGGGIKLEGGGNGTNPVGGGGGIGGIGKDGIAKGKWRLKWRNGWCGSDMGYHLAGTYAPCSYREEDLLAWGYHHHCPPIPLRLQEGALRHDDIVGI
jgi:hypothetical protein